VRLPFLKMRPNLALWWGGGTLSYKSVAVVSATYKILYTREFWSKPPQPPNSGGRYPQIPPKACPE